ncbi:hypothetical protein CMI37_03910 [Candidatus Pacearchaeota archaeon]|nr:hypothetical protein [Candidatus Pacearchaeota archaeon]
MARGKTKGAGSFVQVNLRELNRVLKEDATIIISRRFAETLSLETDNFSATTNNIEAQTPVKIKTEQLQPVEVDKENW